MLGTTLGEPGDNASDLHSYEHVFESRRGVCPRPAFPQRVAHGSGGTLLGPSFHIARGRFQGVRAPERKNGLSGVREAASACPGPGGPPASSGRSGRCQLPKIWSVFGGVGPGPFSFPLSTSRVHKRTENGVRAPEGKNEPDRVNATAATDWRAA